MAKVAEVQLPPHCGVRGCHALVEKKTVGGIDQCCLVILVFSQDPPRKLAKVVFL